MIVGVTPFKYNLSSSVFDTHINFVNTNEITIHQGLVDEIYIEENTDIPYTKNKPIEFLYTTILNAKFKGNMEAGNIQAEGSNINYLLIQKRQIDSTIWTNVAKVKVKPDTEYYEILDKYISLEEEYEYSIIPVAEIDNGLVYGRRNNGSTVKTYFNSMFLSDKEHNFAFMADVTYDDISHIKPSKTHQIFGSKYPTVVYSEMDYSEFTVHALLITQDELHNGLNLKLNRLHRNKVIDWLNNGKPKVYRDNRGDLKIVTVSDTVGENPIGQKEGLNHITITLTEIGNIFDNNDLENLDLLPII